MTNGHEGEGDRPVQLVEQLQIWLTIDNETLVTKVVFVRPRYTWGLIYESKCHWLFTLYFVDITYPPRADG